MKKSIKKGFTLVELLVVIAIIAILSIVGIVGYVSFTNRARVSNDTTIVTELNRVLQAEHVNKKPSTMQDVVDEIFDAGFDLTKLTPTAAKHHIVYDFEGDRFYLLNESYKIVGGEKDNQDLSGDAWDHWKVVQSYSEVEADGQFSYYLGKMKANEEEPAAGIKVSTGIDVGSNAVSKITYERTGSGTREVVIRTNGGALSINAKNDDVKHFGNADSISVVDVKGQSYHENGKVKFLEVSAGHIVLESNSNVSAIHFTATGEGINAKFENEEGKKISLDLSKNTQEEAPVFSRDPVVIEDNGTFVATVTTTSTEYLWLFGAGIKEQMVVTETSGAIATNGELNEGIEIGAETGSIAEQIANPAKRNNEGQLIDENNEVIDTSDIDFSNKDALDTVDVVIEELPEKEDVANGQIYFAGGTGIESDPWLIVDYTTFQNVSNFFDSYHYYKVNLDGCEKDNNGNAYIQCSDWKSINIYGSIDGQNVKLLGLDAPLFRTIMQNENNTDEPVVDIENIKIVNCDIKTSSTYMGILATNAGNKINFTNIDISGRVEGTVVSGFVGFGGSMNIDGIADGIDWTFENCICSATLISTSYSVGFSSHCGGDSTGKFTVINSAYIGQASAGTGSYYYMQQNCSNTSIYETFTAEFLSEHNRTELYKFKASTNQNQWCDNDWAYDDETLSCSLTKSYSKSANDAKYLSRGSILIKNSTKYDSSPKASLPASYGDVFSVTKVKDAAYAMAELIISPDDQNHYGCWTSVYLTEDEMIDISSYAEGDTFDTIKVKYFEIGINHPNTAAGVVGNMYNVVNSKYGVDTHCGAFVRITQYDANGGILNVTTIKIADSTRPS